MKRLGIALLGLTVLLLAGCSNTGSGTEAAGGSLSVQSSSSQPETDANSFTCEPISGKVLEWIVRTFNGGYRFSPDLAVQVEVGEGNTANEMWWVVSFISEGDGVREHRTFLTNAPSTIKSANGELWIAIDGNDPEGSTPQDWSQVNWPPDKIARGEAAEQKALSCLP
jgi:hypothetical protein